jgi:hypothetical protein
VNYRKLNQITKKDRNALPFISEVFDRLSSAKIFTKLDLKDAYHRLHIKKNNKWKIAFRTKYNYFKYLIIPFGLINALATFQAYINHALAGLINIICVVYFDNILIYSQNRKSHIQAICEILARLRAWGLYINLQKSEFHTNKTSFLGFMITPEGLVMN